MILEKLTTALKNKFETELRSGVHVSDLVLCPRRAANRRLNPEPLTMRELNFFTSGRAIGDCLAALAKSENLKYESEKEVKHKNIIAHIDLYDAEHNIPIEVKSARLKEMDEPKTHYVAQLKAYMALLDSDVGIILVQLLQHFDETPFREFEIQQTKGQRKATLAELEKKAAHFEEAITKKDPMLADYIYHDQNLNWLCRDCKMKERCSKEK